MDRFERLFSFVIKPWVLVAFIGFVFFSFFFLDRPIAFFFHALDSKTKLPFLSIFTKLGSNVFYFGPLFILAVCFRYIFKNKKWETRIWFLWFCVLISNVICFALKVSLGRARPFLWFDSDLYGFYWMKLQPRFWSLPSGHTTTVMSLLFGLCILFPRYFYAFMMLGVMVVFSRIILTEHYLSDVLVASYLALVEIGLLLVFFRLKSTQAYNLLKGTLNKTA